MAGKNQLLISGIIKYLFIYVFIYLKDIKAKQEEEEENNNFLEDIRKMIQEENEELYKRVCVFLFSYLFE